MKYMEMINGTEDVRVEYINSIDPNHNKNMYRFLEDNNLLIDMLTNKKYHQGIGGEGYISGREYKAYATEFTYNNEKYAWYEKPLGYKMLVKILPGVFNDNMFNWKRNKKYNSLECTIEFGMFEFLCIYKENKDVVIDVKYAKCDNRHRNKVTLTTIEVSNGSNDKILKAIQQWKESMQNDISAIA